MKNTRLVRSLLFLVKKGIKLALIIALVCTLSFVLLQFAPIDPVRAYVGADMNLISNNQKEIIAKRWGLYQPPHVRFGKWVSQIVKGNFGTSMIFNEPVTSVIKKRFTTSLSLMICAWLFSGIFGFILGIVSGVYNGRPVARFIDLYAYTLASTPTFWLGLVFLMFFSIMLQWTPVSGAAPPGMPPEQVTIGDRIYHLILPCITLSFISIANITLHTKKKVVEIMQSDFITFAFAQGETNFGIIRHHVIRNSLFPAIAIHFGYINEIFGGSVLVEKVFAYPGLGKATVDAGMRGDVPLLLGVTIFSTIFIFSGNAMADLFYKVIDPNIQFKDNSNE